MRNVFIFAWAAVLFGGCMSTKPVDAVTTATPAAPPLRVGVYADRGPGGIGAVEWYRLVDESPDMKLTLLDGPAVRAGALDGLDLLVMPGGSSIAEYESLETNGVAKMKTFIRNGGGYIGTCAGCCLLMDGKRKRANVIPWNTRGSEGDLFFPRFQLTPAGRKALGIAATNIVMRYHGGPFMWPTTNAIADAKFELWGTYDAEASFKGPVKKAKRMYGAAAIIGGTYGKGRVFVTGAHPEYFDSTLYIVEAAFKWVTGRGVAFPVRTRRPRALSVGFLVKGASGIEAAETALALAKDRELDLVPIDKDGIDMRRLDNIDVLVLMDGGANTDPAIAAAVKRFVSRGGRTVACGSAVKKMPAGCVASPSRDGLVKTIHGMFPTK